LLIRVRGILISLSMMEASQDTIMLQATIRRNLVERRHRRMIQHPNTHALLTKITFDDSIAVRMTIKNGSANPSEVKVQLYRLTPMHFGALVDMTWLNVSPS